VSQGHTGEGLCLAGERVVPTWALWEVGAFSFCRSEGPEEPVLLEIHRQYKSRHHKTQSRTLAGSHLSAEPHPNMSSWLLRPLPAVALTREG
jgi:hypothetical protein